MATNFNRNFIRSLRHNRRRGDDGCDFGFESGHFRSRIHFRFSYVQTKLITVRRLSSKPQEFRQLERPRSTLAERTRGVFLVQASNQSFLEYRNFWSRLLSLAISLTPISLSPFYFQLCIFSLPYDVQCTFYSGGLEVLQHHHRFNERERIKCTSMNLYFVNVRKNQSWSKFRGVIGRIRKFTPQVVRELVHCICI